MEDHFETLEQVYDERFARQYGFFRPYVRNVIYRFLDCGILHNGFARVRCGDCGHEYLLAFSCKRRHFCPSCHQKRVVEFGQWLLEEVVKAVPHRHWVFNIPKILRRSFLYDRKLLCDLSRCARETLKQYLQEALPGADCRPGAVIAVQTFGGLLELNLTATSFLPTVDSTARTCSELRPDRRSSPSKRSFATRCSGCSCVAERSARNSSTTSWDDGIQGSMSTTVLESCHVMRTPWKTWPYESRNGKRTKTFDALERLAAMCSHVPNKGEHMVRSARRAFVMGRFLNHNMLFPFFH